MVTKHEYFYSTSDCSGSISMELTGNYSLVLIEDDGDEQRCFRQFIYSHYFDITTLSQVIEFNDDYYLTIHECTDEVEKGVLYAASSSFL